MKADIIHKREVIAAIPRMSRKAFLRSRIYLHWLKSSEIRMSERNVYYPRDAVILAFKMEKIPLRCP